MIGAAANPTVAGIPPSHSLTPATLRTREFGTVFRDTTSSYKFFWLLAIIDLLPDFYQPLPVSRLVQAMVIRAWAAVALFRLSLGKVDRLQDCVRALQASSELPMRTSRARLTQVLDTWPMLPSWVDELARFVPGRFLGSWFPDAARATPYDRRGSRALVAVADRAWGRADSGPYRLIETGNTILVELAPGWRDWLDANRALVLGFAEQQLTRYLQARNPNVPGLVNKLELPRRRSLGPARAWWGQILAQPGEPALTDIFSGETLDGRFEVDHFLPWSFVVHDDFWNLAPVLPGVNRSKSDHLPALDLYLPRLARAAWERSPPPQPSARPRPGLCRVSRRRSVAIDRTYAAMGRGSLSRTGPASSASRRQSGISNRLAECRRHGECTGIRHRGGGHAICLLGSSGREPMG